MTAETPERVSDTLPATETVDAVSVAPFTGEVMLSVGGVLSIFSLILVLAVFPALSVAVPEMI